MAKELESTMDDIQKEDLADLAYKLLNGKKTRKSMLKLMKEANPDMSVPELDAVTEVEEKFSAMEKRLTEKDEQEKKGLLLKKIEDGRKAVKERFSLKDEDIKEIEQRIEKGELPANYERAGELFKMERAYSKPASTSFRDLSTPKIPQIDLKNTNLDAWARDTALNALQELRQGK